MCNWCSSICDFSTLHGRQESTSSRRLAPNVVDLIPEVWFRVRCGIFPEIEVTWNNKGPQLEALRKWRKFYSLTAFAWLERLFSTVKVNNRTCDCHRGSSNIDAGFRCWCGDFQWDFPGVHVVLDIGRCWVALICTVTGQWQPMIFWVSLVDKDSACSLKISRLFVSWILLYQGVSQNRGPPNYIWKAPLGFSRKAEVCPMWKFSKHVTRQWRWRNGSRMVKVFQYK